MSDLVFNIYKKSGVTPLECINILKKDHPELKFLPMTYAGRLDPLAEGVLLILAGDECYQKEKYLNLPKEYEVEVLFGFATDTYDAMGLVTKTKELFGKDTSPENNRFERSSDEGEGSRCQTISNRSFSDFVLEIQNILPNFIGKIKQAYPPYSSRPVKGQPLFKWARDGKLDEIEIPTHNVQVNNIEVIGNNEITGKDLLEEIKEKIVKVKGDFRQKEILDIWEKELRNKEEEKYLILKLKISCGSGVYVRGLAHEIGEKLGIGALAFKIVRTKLGEYTI